MSDEVADLMRRAGRRPCPPPELASRVFERSLDVFEAQYGRTARRRRWGLGIAAAIALVVLAAPVLWMQLGARPIVARVVSAGPGGSASGGDGAGQARELPQGAPIYAGDGIRASQDQTLLLRRDDDLAVRLDAGATITWRTVDEVAVESGRAYFETHAPALSTDSTRLDWPSRAPSAALRVMTSTARVEHLGTRFSVEVAAGSTLIAVRDGRVRVTATAGRVGAPVDLRGNEVARVSASAGPQRMPDLPQASWRWTDAPPGSRVTVIQDRTPDEVLAELAGAAGLRLVYVDAAVADQAHNRTLSGPPLRLAPREALRAVLLASGFTAEYPGDSVLVRSAEP